MATTGGVLITGASTGIGRACALDLVRRGFRVFAGVRKEADGSRLVQAAEGILEPLILDVTDEGLIRGAVDTISDALGEEPLVGLVNNAGITVSGPLEFVPVAEMRRQFEVNVIGQHAVTQAFLAQLRRAKGRIVLMGSVWGRLTMPGVGAYCMSKHAIEAMADALRFQLKPWGMHVALIEPGLIATPIWEKGFRDWSAFLAQAPKELTELYGSQIAGTERMVAEVQKAAQPPEVVARAVAHALISNRPRSRYLVGGRVRQQRFLATLPDAWRDWVFAKLLA